MANQRLKLHIPKTLPKTIPPVMAPDHPTMLKWMKQAEDHFDSMVTGTTEGMVQQGFYLRRIKDHLEHGHFMEWIEGNFRYSQRRANQMMQVEEFSRVQKKNYNAIKHLGFSKVLALSSLNPRQLQAIIARRAVKFPGMEKALPLAQVPVRIIQEQVNRMNGQNVFNPLPKLQGAQSSVRSIIRTVERLFDFTDDIAPHNLEPLENGLVEALNKVRKLRKGG